MTADGSRGFQPRSLYTNRQERCDEGGYPVAERPLMVAGRFNARDKSRIFFRRGATVERVGWGGIASVFKRRSATHEFGKRRRMPPTRNQGAQQHLRFSIPLHGPAKASAPSLPSPSKPGFIPPMKSFAILILTCTLSAAQVDSQKLLIQFSTQAEGPGLVVTSTDEKDPSAFP